jgi:CMP-N-acetylneuraminic acid synthetase
MYLNKRVLAVIPARGGSKGVPRKNVRDLNGRPLIAYTIDQARAVSELDHFVVSTDDPEIKAISQRLGAAVVDRPAELATDTASTEVALLHALDTLADAAVPGFDYVVVLEPTSPMRSAATIGGCIRQAIERGASSLMTVRETRENIGTLVDGCFRPLVPDAPRRRQARQPFYVESSTVYVARVDYLRRTRTLVARDWAAYVVPNEEAEDINTLADFIRVQCLMRQQEGA